MENILEEFALDNIPSELRLFKKDSLFGRTMKILSDSEDKLLSAYHSNHLRTPRFQLMQCSASAIIAFDFIASLCIIIAIPSRLILIYASAGKWFSVKDTPYREPKAHENKALKSGEKMKWKKSECYAAGDSGGCITPSPTRSFMAF